MFSPVLLVALAWPLPDDAAAGQSYVVTHARISHRRGQNLEVALAPVGEPRVRVVLSFPGHSLTAHERQLRAAVETAVPVRSGDDPYDWVAAGAT